MTRNLIGFVGQPGHGKSTAIARLQSDMGAVVFDTGAPLRRACIALYDLTWSDVSTQEGKLGMVYRPEYGDRVTVRQALGDYGKVREAQGDDKNIWTTLSVQEALHSLYPLCVFDSVRMGQGEVIQQAGGMVIEIVDPRKPKSLYDFDQYDPSFINATIWNNGTIEKFEDDVLRVTRAVMMSIDTKSRRRAA